MTSYWSGDSHLRLSRQERWGLKSKDFSGDVMYVWLLRSFFCFILTNLSLISFIWLVYKLCNPNWSEVRRNLSSLKREVVKRENKQELKQGFPNRIGRWRKRLEILLGGILTISCKWNFYWAITWTLKFGKANCSCVRNELLLVCFCFVFCFYAAGQDSHSFRGKC